MKELKSFGVSKVESFVDYVTVGFHGVSQIFRVFQMPAFASLCSTVHAKEEVGSTSQKTWYFIIKNYFKIKYKKKKVIAKQLFEYSRTTYKSDQTFQRRH